MNLCSSTKLVTGEEERKVPLRQPLRVHELLGLPKSTGKSVEPQRSQPIRVKYLLESMESSSKKPVEESARGKPISAHGGNVRRQLYCEADDEPLTEKSNANSATGAHKKPLPVRFLGLSRSDGKAKLNERKTQPIRVKHLMESWEKSQTDKIAAPKFSIGERRTTNARRRLDNIYAAPVLPKKVVKKPAVLEKPQERSTGSTQIRKLVKPTAEKSVKYGKPQESSRKSCLLPPNSIRDKYLSRVNEIVVEETQNVDSSPIENLLNSEIISKEQNLNSKNLPEIKKHETIVDVNSTSPVACNANCPVTVCEREFEKVCDKQSEIIRPSVIMGLVTSTGTKNPPVASECTSEFNLSRPPLQELNKNSTMPINRIDQTDTSFEDLFGNSQKFRLAQMDPQTLSWLRGNLKLCIQGAEENLFTMKQMLRTIDDIAEKNSQTTEKPFDGNRDVASEITIEHCDEIVNKCENDDVDKENVPSINVELNTSETNASGKKERRRSARLAARSPKNSDDSFLLKEAELNITHVKSKPGTPRNDKATRGKSVDARNRKSIREYMAMKSSISFLETPDQKGFPTPKTDMRGGTPAERRAIERALSRRLMIQLTDLYDESSD